MALQGATSPVDGQDALARPNPRGKGPAGSVRLAVAARDQTCQHERLGVSGGCGGAMHIHHVVPVWKGGGDEIENLALVCERHHVRIHKLIHPMPRARASRRTTPEDLYARYCARCVHRDGPLTLSSPCLDCRILSRIQSRMVAKSGQPKPNRFERAPRRLAS